MQHCTVNCGDHWVILGHRTSYTSYMCTRSSATPSGLHVVLKSELTEGICDTIYPQADNHKLIVEIAKVGITRSNRQPKLNWQSRLLTLGMVAYLTSWPLKWSQIWDSLFGHVIEQPVLWLTVDSEDGRWPPWLSTWPWQCHNGVRPKSIVPFWSLLWRDKDVHQWLHVFVKDNHGYL